MAEKPSIIAFGPNDWLDIAWDNRQQVLSRLAARGWSTVYSNGALSVWDRDKPMWRKARWLGRVEAHDGVSVYFAGRVLPRWPSRPAADRLALRHHAQQLNHAVPRTRVRWAVVFHPEFHPYLEFLDYTHLTYYVYDTYPKMPSWHAGLDRLHADLVERADLVVCSSAAMARELPGNGPERAVVLPNGVETDLFIDAAAKAECPADLAAIPHPRIVWAGAISRKVDLPLVAECAARRPEWHWVLIGRFERNDIEATEPTRRGLERCEALPNVHFLGEKPRRAVPAYLRHSDVTALCYRSEGGWWVDCSPMKLHEALAVGHPVISAPLDAVLPFRDVVRVASGPDEWVAALDEAILNGGLGNPVRRRAVALENSWDQRVGLYESWMLQASLA